MFLKNRTSKSIESFSEQLERLGEALETADAVFIGAGAGLSTSAGFTYSGERFEQYFSDFHEKYGFTDMYSGGFYPYRTLEEYWAFWSRYIWVNRYQDAPKSVYDNLRKLVEGKDYFVLTTNVDHCFQKAGFDKHKLFYTQGDYGLFQCSNACHNKTYENEEIVRQMLEAQGYVIEADNSLTVPDGTTLKLVVPAALVPHCPRCGRPMTMNLRCDDTFVQDDGWDLAKTRYTDFLRRHPCGKVLYLELGVGGNTPVIIKYPFWNYTARNQEAVYACVNYGEACAPKDIINRSICLDADIGAVLRSVLDRGQSRKIASAALP